MQTLEALQIKSKPRHPVFLGFPLHAAGRPSDARGAHLFEIKVPMLFLQGTRDALAATELIEHWSGDLVIGQASSCSRMRIIHFMCPQGAGGPPRKSNPKCWMSWQPGSSRRVEPC